MTCKECMHYEACDMYEDLDGYRGKTICSNFSDKSELVHLPCKVGDYVEWDNGICLSLKQVRGFMYCGDGLGLRYVLEDCEPIVNISNIKRIVPREEAEKALERRKK